MLASTSKNAARVVRRSVPGVAHRAYAVEATSSPRAPASNRPHTIYSSNELLERHAATGRPLGSLMTALSMKNSNMTPDIHSYYYLIEALTKAGEWREAWALLDDAKLSGHVPDASMYNRLLYGVSRESPDVSWKVFDSMKKDGVAPNEETYRLLLSRSLAAGNFEMSMKILFDMEKNDFQPSLDGTQALLNLALDRGLVRVAHEIAQNYEDGGVRTLQPELWVKMLTVATDLYYADGLPALWKKVINDLNLTPDEGTCVEALRVAGRFGLADLAVEALRILRAQKVALQEYHFAPMVQAFVRANRLKDAFAVLCLLKAQNLPVTLAAAQPIFQAIHADPALLEPAWAAVEELHTEGTALDASCVNVLIQVSVAQGDLQRALGAHSILAELGLSATPETFDILMSGASAAKNRALGETLLADMKAANLVPTAETYERVIGLALIGDDYENAFQYLEDMKAAGYTPSGQAYENIIRRCIAGQDERYFMAVEEMQSHGHKKSRQLDEWMFRQREARRNRQAAASGPEIEYL
ncbi:unnamed protein product [Peniophora sp. CBMAI 1063]|nr:unnamed protein product [Peniophora sp. CBMAI 1063]